MKLSLAFLTIIMPWKAFSKMFLKAPVKDLCFHLTGPWWRDCTLFVSQPFVLLCPSFFFTVTHHLHHYQQGNFLCCCCVQPVLFYSSSFLCSLSISYYRWPCSQEFCDELVPTLHSSGKFKESLSSVYLPNNSFIFPNLWGFLTALFNIVLHRMGKKNKSWKES